ncbi:MAG: DUF480 domain-containing protein [Acidobacteriota bacterium]
MSEQESGAERLILHPEERRVLGVLIEKSLATPDYYPMTLKALVAACNQKSNRHPVSSYDDGEVQEALSSLLERRYVLAVKDSGGRSTKWRHEMQRVFDLQGKQAAVLAELLLRGPQTEGELRARASRMRQIDDLDGLHEVLEQLRDRRPTFARRLSPEGATRGVRHAHELYTDEERERLSVETVEQGSAVEASAAPVARSRTVAEVEVLQGQVTELQARLAATEARLGRLETALGIEETPGAPEQAT